MPKTDTSDVALALVWGKSIQKVGVQGKSPVGSLVQGFSTKGGVLGHLWGPRSGSRWSRADVFAEYLCRDIAKPY